MPGSWRMPTHPSYASMIILLIYKQNYIFHMTRSSKYSKILHNG